MYVMCKLINKNTLFVRLMFSKINIKGIITTSEHYCLMSLFVILGAIWYYLYNLKNVKKTHRRALLLIKLQAESCNFTKSNTPLWVCFTSFKLQMVPIIQHITQQKFIC